MNTKSNKRKVIINGREFDSIQNAASTFGLSRNTVDYRLSKGWTPEEAVGLEPRPSHAEKTLPWSVSDSDSGLNTNSHPTGLYPEKRIL